MCFCMIELSHSCYHFSSLLHRFWSPGRRQLDVIPGLNIPVATSIRTVCHAGANLSGSFIVTSTHSPLSPSRSSDYASINRRRWVPKGVMLLIILFDIGLITACHRPAPGASLAEIVVPVKYPMVVSCLENSQVSQVGTKATDEADLSGLFRSESARLRMF